MATRFAAIGTELEAVSVRADAAGIASEANLEQLEAEIRADYERALLLVAEGHIEDAESAYERLLELPLFRRGPHEAHQLPRPCLVLKFLVLKNLAHLREDRSRFGSAVDLYVQAMAVLPEACDSLLLYRIGSLARRLHMLSLARAALEKSLLHDRTNLLCLRELKFVLNDIGDDVALKRLGRYSTDVLRARLGKRTLASRRVDSVKIATKRRAVLRPSRETCGWGRIEPVCLKLEVDSWESLVNLLLEHAKALSETRRLDVLLNAPVQIRMPDIAVDEESHPVQDVQMPSSECQIEMVVGDVGEEVIVVKDDLAMDVCSSEANSFLVEDIAHETVLEITKEVFDTLFSSRPSDSESLPTVVSRVLEEMLVKVENAFFQDDALQPPGSPSESSSSSSLVPTRRVLRSQSKVYNEASVAGEQSSRSQSGSDDGDDSDDFVEVFGSKQADASDVEFEDAVNRDQKVLLPFLQETFVLHHVRFEDGHVVVEAKAGSGDGPLMQLEAHALKESGSDLKVPCGSSSSTQHTQSIRGFLEIVGSHVDSMDEGLKADAEVSSTICDAIPVNNSGIIDILMRIWMSLADGTIDSSLFDQQKLLDIFLFVEPSIPANNDPSCRLLAAEVCLDKAATIRKRCGRKISMRQAAKYANEAGRLVGYLVSQERVVSCRHSPHMDVRIAWLKGLWSMMRHDIDSAEKAFLRCEELLQQESDASKAVITLGHCQNDNSIQAETIQQKLQSIALVHVCQQAQALSSTDSAVSLNHQRVYDILREFVLQESSGRLWDDVPSENLHIVLRLFSDACIELKHVRHNFICCTKRVIYASPPVYTDTSSPIELIEESLRALLKGLDALDDIGRENDDIEDENGVETVDILSDEMCVQLKIALCRSVAFAFHTGSSRTVLSLSCVALIQTCAFLDPILRIDIGSQLNLMEQAHSLLASSHACRSTSSRFLQKVASILRSQRYVERCPDDRIRVRILGQCYSCHYQIPVLRDHTVHDADFGGGFDFKTLSLQECSELFDYAVAVMPLARDEGAKAENGVFQLYQDLKESIALPPRVPADDFVETFLNAPDFNVDIIPPCVVMECSNSAVHLYTQYYMEFARNIMSDIGISSLGYRISSQDAEGVTLVQELLTSELQLRPRSWNAWYDLGLSFLHALNLPLLGCSSVLFDVRDDALQVLQKHYPKASNILSDSGSAANTGGPPSPSSKKKRSQKLSMKDEAFAENNLVNKENEAQGSYQKSSISSSDASDIGFEAISQSWWSDALDEVALVTRKRLDPVLRSRKCLRYVHYLSWPSDDILQCLQDETLGTPTDELLVLTAKVSEILAFVGFRICELSSRALEIGADDDVDDDIRIESAGDLWMYADVCVGRAISNAFRLSQEVDQTMALLNQLVVLEDMLPERILEQHQHTDALMLDEESGVCSESSKWLYLCLIAHVSRYKQTYASERDLLEQFNQAVLVGGEVEHPLYALHSLRMDLALEPSGTDVALLENYAMDSSMILEYKADSSDSDDDNDEEDEDNDDVLFIGMKNPPGLPGLHKGLKGVLENVFEAMRVCRARDPDDFAPALRLSMLALNLGDHNRLRLALNEILPFVSSKSRGKRHKYRRGSFQPGASSVEKLRALQFDSKEDVADDDCVQAALLLIRELGDFEALDTLYHNAITGRPTMRCMRLYASLLAQSFRTWLAQCGPPLSISPELYNSLLKRTFECCLDLCRGRHRERIFMPQLLVFPYRIMKVLKDSRQSFDPHLSTTEEIRNARNWSASNRAARSLRTSLKSLPVVPRTEISLDEYGLSLDVPFRSLSQAGR